MTYIYRFEIAAIIISLAVMITLFRNKVITTRSIYAFSTMNLFVILSSAFDIISIFLLEKGTDIPLWLNFLFNGLYQLCFHTIPICFYTLIVLLTNSNKLKSKPKFLITSIPYILAIILILSTPLTHSIFYFDQNYTYTHGPFIYYLYVQAFFYAGLGLITIFRNKKHFSFDNRFVIFFYTIVSMTSVIVQFFFPQLMIMGFILSISVLLSFLYLENPEDYLDKEMNIYNRNAFIAIIGPALEKKQSMKFLGIKYEEIKYLNQTIGVKNRISLMRTISTYLQNICDKKKIFRLSRSKIVILLNNDPEVMNNQIQQIKEKLLEPIKFDNVELSLSVFLDIVSCPEDAETVEDTIDLIENSFTNLISLENMDVVHADRSILQKRKREHQILLILEQAINNNDFEVIYQPIYSLKENRYTTAEALLRLKNFELGLIKPEEFIPLAEKNGMILKIGHYVFKSVCKFLSESRIWEKGIEYIHINLSVIQCMQEKLYEQLFEIMDYYNLNYKYINLEITETSANASQEILKNNMKIMIEKHIKFSLDDYGTGFSNTSSLLNYPFQIIKIDKFLIWDAIKDKKAEIILKQTISMIKDLNMAVVAEGVETQEQMLLVKSLGCDYIQGYYYSYPLQEKDFLIFMN